MPQDIESEIRAFIADNFLFREDVDTIENDQSLLESGLIDSTGVLELVAFLESHYDLRIADAEIIPSNLDSVAALVRFVSAKLAEKAPA